MINDIYTTLLSFKAPIKTFLFENHLGSLWNLLPNILFNWKVFIGGLLPCLIIMYFTKRLKDRPLWTPEFAIDTLYPFMNLLITSSISIFIMANINIFYQNILSFMTIDILSNYSEVTQFFILFIVIDFLFYWIHRLKHSVTWLWPFHAIHHHQRHLNPMTTHRVHFGEIIISHIIKAFPLLILGGTITPYYVYIVLNNFWGYFIHSDIRINLGFLNKIIVTPEYHHVHHSIEKHHYNKNYGERLVLWDYIFGTYLPTTGKEFPKTGVMPTAERFLVQSTSLKELLRVYFMQLYYPFYCIAKKLKNIIRT